MTIPSLLDSVVRFWLTIFPSSRIGSTHELRLFAEEPFGVLFNRVMSAHPISPEFAQKYFGDPSVLEERRVLQVLLVLETIAGETLAEISARYGEAVLSAILAATHGAQLLRSPEERESRRRDYLEEFGDRELQELSADFEREVEEAISNGRSGGRGDSEMKRLATAFIALLHASIGDLAVLSRFASGYSTLSTLTILDDALYHMVKQESAYGIALSCPEPQGVVSPLN